jgi:citrate lyase subunit beta/citryl-CoA lyase
MADVRGPSSYLYAPGNRGDLLRKALGSNAHAVICDLEDSVPAAEKAAARATVADFLQEARAGARWRDIYLRINAGADGLAELGELLGRQALTGVLLPKSEGGEQIAAVSALLDAREGERSAMLIQPIIESAAGLFSLADQAKASRRVRRFSFGAADFLADLGAAPTADRTETLFARSLVVAQSRALGLNRPVAHVYGELSDDDGLRRACVEDRALGFGGRACIHPRQVPIVNAAFAPTEAELIRARAISEAYEQAAATGRGALRLDDGTFVDEAIVRAARDLLASVAPPAGR